MIEHLPCRSFYVEQLVLKLDPVAVHPTLPFNKALVNISLRHRQGYL